MDETPTLLVFMDPGTGKLAWKPKGVKGARWKGKCDSLAEVSEESKDAIPRPCDIEFVDVKD
jgi:hypothetical protein